MQSLWTPNVKVMRVTEEGFESTEVIPGNLTPEKLSVEEINKIKERILTGGHVGSIVSNELFSCHLTNLRDFLKSSIKSFGSSSPICNLTYLSSLFKFKYFLLPLSDFPWCKARLSKPPQLYPYPNSFNEFTNLITDFLLFDLIFNPINPDAPE